MTEEVVLADQVLEEKQGDGKKTDKKTRKKKTKKRSRTETVGESGESDVDGVDDARKRIVKASPKKPKRFMFYRNPNINAYKEALENYNEEMKIFRQERQAWAKKIVKKDKGIPYEKRSTASLQRACYAKGIDAKGVRDVLVQRLLRHDLDEHDVTVTTNDMLFFHKVAPPTVFVNPQAQCYPYAATEQIEAARRDMGILMVLPHDIIRNCLKFLDEIDDYQSFMSFMMTCKYVHADVTAVLSDRATSLFGPGGSLKALSALNYITTYSWGPLIFSEGRPLNDIFQFHWRMMHVFGLQQWCDSVEDIIPCSLSDTPKTLGLQIVKKCVSKYGSIEGLCDYRFKQKRLSANKQLDEDIVYQGRKDRFDKFTEALTNLGYPKMFDFVQVEKSSRGPVLSLSAKIMEALAQSLSPEKHKAFLKLWKKCNKHIRKAEPLTLRAVMKWWKDFPAEVFQNKT